MSGPHSDKGAARIRFCVSCGARRPAGVTVVVTYVECTFLQLPVFVCDAEAVAADGVGRIVQKAGKGCHGAVPVE